MRKFLIGIMMVASAISLHAQEDPEYRMEIGAGAGLTGYLGDFNDNLMKGQQPMAGLLMRYNFNPYMGLKLNADYGKVKGKSTDVDTYYPDLADNPYEFSNTMVDVGVTYEYNFFPYGTGRDYYGAKRLTPFLFGGIGMTYVKTGNGDKKSVVTANVPIGIGLKYKIGERMNLGLEWAMHFSLSDELDGMADPYGIKSTGMFKNTDCYSALKLTLTYSFSAKCRTCHNEDE